MGVNNPQRRDVLTKLKTNFERQRRDEIAPVPGLGGSGATHAASAVMDAAADFAAGVGQAVIAPHILIDPEDLYHIDTGVYDVLEPGFYAMSLVLELAGGVEGKAYWIPPGTTEGAVESFAAGDTDLNVGGVVYIDAKGGLVPQIDVTAPGSIKVRHLSVVQLLALYQDPATIPTPPGGWIAGDPLSHWHGGSNSPGYDWVYEDWTTLQLSYLFFPSGSYHWSTVDSGPDVGKLIPQVAGMYNVELALYANDGFANEAGDQCDWRISGNVSAAASDVVADDLSMNTATAFDVWPVVARGSGHFNGTTDFVKFEAKSVVPDPRTFMNAYVRARALLMSTP